MAGDFLPTHRGTVGASADSVTDVPDDLLLLCHLLNIPTADVALAAEGTLESETPHHEKRTP